MSMQYLIYNSALATTAAPTSQPTGAALRTMMQLKVGTNFNGAKVVEWGISFDGTTANTPGKVELVETGTIFATMSTAYAAADIQPWGDPNTPANTAGASGIPFNLATTASGFATAGVTEGTVTTTRMLDVQMLPPTAPYVKQFPYGREPMLNVGTATRVRVTFGTTVNVIIYMIVEF